MCLLTMRAEDEARTLLQKLYSLKVNDCLTVVDLLESLKRFQSSPVEREKDIIKCIIKDIFEERKFFQAYPMYLLLKIGHLFGGIIEHGFISNDKDLNEAYNFILDALKNSSDSKMFNFGIIALDQIKHLLFNRHEYCSEISKIPHLNDFPPDLIKCVNYGKNQQNTEKFQESFTTIPRVSPKMQKPIDIVTIGYAESDVVTSGPDTLITTDVAQSCEHLITKSADAEKTFTAAVMKPLYYINDNTMLVPPENVQRKLVFIFNNLSQKNVKKECAEVKENLKRTYLPWLSVMLTKRICNEFQFHSLYSACLEYFNCGELNELIELETARKIKILLAKENSPQTKIMLKNLGHWLGLITLARDKPAPFDLEKMVIEAYVKGVDELEFTLSFVAKTLESCVKSKVYGPKTSWTISILNCLAELYQSPGLKLMFQFEIELLCKVLNVELKEFTGYELKNTFININV